MTTPPPSLAEIRQKHAWTHGREDPDCRPSRWACIALRMVEEVERLKKEYSQCYEFLKGAVAREDRAIKRAEAAEAEVERLKTDIGRRMISASEDRRASEAREKVLREMLLHVESWMQCDLKEHGPGPSGGYTERLRRVREALARTEAGEPKG